MVSCTNLPQIFSGSSYLRLSKEEWWLLSCVLWSVVQNYGVKPAVAVSSEYSPTQRTFFCLAPVGHILLPRSCLEVILLSYIMGFFEWFISVSFSTMNIYSVISYLKLKIYPLYCSLPHLSPSPCSWSLSASLLFLPLLLNN